MGARTDPSYARHRENKEWLALWLPHWASKTNPALPQASPPFPRDTAGAMKGQPRLKFKPASQAHSDHGPAAGLVFQQSAARALSTPACQLMPVAFNRLPDLFGDVDAVKPLQFLNSGGRRHVDLGQVFANHVNTDEYLTLVAQQRAYRRANLAIPVRTNHLFGPPADMHVRARLACRRHAIDRTNGLSHRPE